MLKPQLRLGDALAKRGRYAEAEVAYLRALELRAHHPGARNNLGALYKSLGRWEEAEAQFRTLLEVSPDISHARLNLADLQLRRGQWLEAEAECLHALEFEDTGGEAQKKLALIALQFRADPERALAYCEEGLTLNPDAATWTMRGVALRALEREAEAENSYRRALALEPKSLDTWFNLGNLYRDRGEPDAALRAYGRVLEWGSDSSLGVRANEEIDQLTTKQ